MNKLVLALVTVLALVLSQSEASAALVTFTLGGQAGAGLLPGNETGSVNSGPLGELGSGGLGSGGISLDTDTNLLSIHVVWGSGNGFTDLNDDNGAVNGFHIHGPATETQSSGVLVNLGSATGFDPSTTSGGFNGAIVVDDAVKGHLLNNLTYLNVHTSGNTGGEIRGQLVSVPEPSSLALLGCVAVGSCIIARRRKRNG